MALLIFINWYHIFVYLYFYRKTYNKEIYIFNRIILLPLQRVWTAWAFICMNKHVYIFWGTTIILYVSHYG